MTQDDAPAIYARWGAELLGPWDELDPGHRDAWRELVARKVDAEPTADYDARLTALTDRLYAERDALPSHRRYPHAVFRREDAAHLARAVLSSDLLVEAGVIPPVV